MLPTPNEAEVKRVQEQLGLEYLQAYRHVQQRMQLAKRPNPYPLGKSQHYA